MEPTNENYKESYKEKLAVEMIEAKELIGGVYGDPRAARTQARYEKECHTDVRYEDSRYFKNLRGMDKNGRVPKRNKM